MCFTHKKIKEKRKSKKTKIYPEPSITTPTFTMDESIRCQGCFQKFPLDQIKINCAGCDKFFHCKVAGTCYGENCKEETRAGRLHRLSWCVNCVPKIPENKEKVDRTEECICNKCHP
jgi:hypothetical protein